MKEEARTFVIGHKRLSALRAAAGLGFGGLDLGELHLGRVRPEAEARVEAAVDERRLQEDEKDKEREDVAQDARLEPEPERAGVFRRPHLLLPAAHRLFPSCSPLKGGLFVGRCCSACGVACGRRCEKWICSCVVPDQDQTPPLLLLVPCSPLKGGLFVWGCCSACGVACGRRCEKWICSCVVPGKDVAQSAEKSAGKSDEKESEVGRDHGREKGRGIGRGRERVREGQREMSAVDPA